MRSTVLHKCFKFDVIMIMIDRLWSYCWETTHQSFILCTTYSSSCHHHFYHPLLQ